MTFVTFFVQITAEVAKFPRFRHWRQCWILHLFMKDRMNHKENKEMKISFSNILFYSFVFCLRQFPCFKLKFEKKKSTNIPNKNIVSEKWYKPTILKISLKFKKKIAKKGKEKNPVNRGKKIPKKEWKQFWKKSKMQNIEKKKCGKNHTKN